MITVLSVAGARPNFMKVAPIHRAMAAHGGFRPVFVHTGQHYDAAMSDVFLSELGLPPPDWELGVGSGSHADQTAQVMVRLQPVLEESRPDVVVVVGDVNSTVAAAPTAAKAGVPVAHVEAGLRSFDRTMPEEVNRVVTDVLSDLLFAPSEDAVGNLAAEGIAGDHVHLVGNVMIDSLDALLPRARESDLPGRLGLGERGYFLATMHRPANVDGDAAILRTVQTLSAAARILPVVLPAHPRTLKRLDAAGLLNHLSDAGIRAIEPLGYTDFLAAMASAAGVLTDSGGVQEETTALGIPCLTLRENTERPVTVTHGTNTVVGLDPDRVAAEAERIASAPRPASERPFLWDGHTAERIVEVLAAGGG